MITLPTNDQIDGFCAQYNRDAYMALAGVPRGLWRKTFRTGYALPQNIHERYDTFTVERLHARAMYENAQPVEQDSAALAILAEDTLRDKVYDTQGALLIGDVGSGKTHLCAAFVERIAMLTHAGILRNNDCYWLNVPALYHFLPDEYGQCPNLELLLRYLTTPLTRSLRSGRIRTIVLDDLGTELDSLTVAQRDRWLGKFFTFIDTLISEGARFVCTTNKKKSVLIGDPTAGGYGERIAQRILRSTGDPIILLRQDTGSATMHPQSVPVHKTHNASVA